MPEYKRLADAALRGRLVTIRDAVTPILASNLLRPFTDHSVAHSDQVCEILDQLTAPLSPALCDREAFILYAAAYLHDVGMHHERCDETQAMTAALAHSPYAGTKWAALEEKTRWDLLRQHHHEISSEMVRQSVDAPQPTVLGVQLTQRDSPAFVAALCEAHCTTPDTPRYAE